MVHVRVLRSAGLVLLLGVLLVAAVWALPADAADQTVLLVDDAFDPDEVSVVAGDTITWRWEGDNRHGVRVVRLDGSIVYDSHPQCSSEEPGACGSKGLTRRWSPQETGDFRFFCPVHGTALFGMSGSLAVQPAPSPGASPAPSPSSEPTSEPDDDPSRETPADEGDGGADGGDDAGNDGGNDGAEPANGSSPSPRRTQGTSTVPGIRYGPPAALQQQPPPTILPSVAPSQSPTGEVEDPDLEAFPEGPDVSPTTDAAGTVAIDAPRGPSPRTVWLGVGAASVLTAAGAFTKLVLLGAPWT